MNNHTHVPCSCGRSKLAREPLCACVCVSLCVVIAGFCAQPAKSYWHSSSPPLSIKLHPHARMICVEIHQHTHILTHSFILGMVQRNPRCPTISQHTPGEIVLESKSMLLHIESIRQVHWNNMTFAFCELCGQTSLSRHISCTTSSTCVTLKQTNFYLILVQIFKIFPRTFSITKCIFQPFEKCFLLLLLID